MEECQPCFGDLNNWKYDRFREIEINGNTAYRKQDLVMIT